MTAESFSPETPHLSAPSEECAIVHTGTFQCLAYRDAEGAWRDAYHPDGPPLKVLYLEGIPANRTLR